MPTKSVKITEKSTSIREALSAEAALDAPLEDSIPSEAEALKPYRRELDEFLFHEGTARHAYDYLGAHAEMGEDGEERVIFRVWAPHAQAVSVVGLADDWKNGIPMIRATANGIFILALPGDKIPDGAVYKYRITAPDGQTHLRSDPYGRAMECPPDTATRFFREKPFHWHDGGWLKHRQKRASENRKYPMNIYEVHAGSWKYGPDGKPLSYRQLADELAPYIKQMGFTHVELLPVMEHPFGGSWGYQVCGYYAPTARYGDPEDFKAFVDIMHNAGIGVILDWVPAHFPKDAHGLFHFDGRPLYEYEDPTRQENRGWGTCCFNVGKKEVISFLLSNAYYWVEEFHADGLRVDAVASMLYLNYDRPDGAWHPNKNGGYENLEAVAFFRLLNQGLHTDHPDVMTIAEDSTMWPHITDFTENGLGFTYKWNMGWMNDTLRYAGEDPIFRRHHHGTMTHIPSYAFIENYVLPISHDEVVHLKKSFLDKMPGDYWQKFAGARAFAAWMMTLPGAKLWFMGCEIGQFAEWSEERQLDWYLLDYEFHWKLQHYFAALNNLYLTTPALWDEYTDTPEKSFEWLESHNAEQSIFAFRRVSREGRDVTVILNFTPVAHVDHNINVPLPGKYREIFNSDDPKYGGSGVLNTGTMEAFPVEGNLLHRVRVNVPPMGVTVLERVEEKNEGLCP